MRAPIIYRLYMKHTLEYLEKQLTDAITNHEKAGTSHRYNKLSGRHKKLYMIRAFRIYTRKVRGLYPSIIAASLVDVQPMTTPTGTVFKIKYSC